MNYDLRDSHLSTVLAEAALVGDETKRLFSRLSGEQVNWKPRAGEWSIGQCFDHLLISNRPYVPIFEEILAGRRRPRLWERMPLLPRLFGRLLINLLRPTRVAGPRRGRPSTRRAIASRQRSSRPSSSSRGGCSVSWKRAATLISTR
jgi:hypothetical protein